MLCALMLLALAISSPAQAADYYVATTGSDTGGDGSSARPWQTISHAAAQVAAADTVHVLAGVYAESVQSSASGTAGQRIRFVSEPGWGAKIDATGHYTAWQNSGDYVDIVGFDITGADYLGISNGGSYVRVVSNHVHHLATPTCNRPNGGAAIDHDDYSKHDNDTIGNFVDHVADQLVGCNQIHGIYHSNLRGHIWNNIVGQIGAYCIHNWHASTDVVIANNLVFGCKSGGIIVGDGDSPGGVTANNFVVTNNIVLDSPNGILEYGSFGTNNVYVNNLVYRCSVPLMLTNPDQGTLSVEPMLVDYRIDATGDYHLMSASPCVDHGVATGAPSDDFEGHARPFGAGIDIGPYEWVAPGPDGGMGADAAADAAVDARPDGSRSEAGASGGGATEYGGGCGCHAAGRLASPSAVRALALVAGVLVGRRRRRPRA